MWTIQYRGYFIHGNFCDDDCRVMNGKATYSKSFGSLKAAKRGIAILIKKGLSGTTVGS